MFLELFTACKNGDKDACARLYFIYWLSPRIEHMLKKLAGGVALIPLLVPVPLRPDPPPEIDAGFLRERAVVKVVLGDPNPQPNIFPREVRLKTTIALRDAMMKMVESLNADIESLGEQKK